MSNSKPSNQDAKYLKLRGHYISTKSPLEKCPHLFCILLAELSCNQGKFATKCSRDLELSRVKKVSFSALAGEKHAR